MQFKFMTYNILDGGADRVPSILNVIRAAAPDVVLLQEVFEPGLVQEFAAALGWEGYFARGNNIRHLALLSRYPIVAPRTHRPVPIRCAVLEAALKLDGVGLLQLLGIHLAPFVAWYREIWRALEVGVILRRAARYANVPLLIAGDCNAIAPGDHVEWLDTIPTWLRRMLWLQGGRVFHWALARVLAAGYTDCFRYLHPDEQGFTLPTPRPHARLDYVFVNDHLKPHVRRCRVVRDVPAAARASDHYPLLAEFEW